MSSSKFQLLSILWTTLVLLGCSNTDSPTATGQTPTNDVSDNSLTADEVNSLGGVEEFVSEAYVEQTIASRDVKHWYGIEIAGQRLGYTISRMRKTKKDEPGVYMIGYVIHLGVGLQSTISTHSAFFAAAPYKAVELRTSEVTPAGKIARTFIRKDNKTLVETVVDGKRQADLWAPDMCGTLRSALGEIAPEFSRITSASRGRICSFSADDQKQHVIEVQVKSIGTRLVKGIETPVVTLQSKTQEAKEWLEVTITEDGTSLETTKGSSMFIRLEDSDVTKKKVVRVDANTASIKLEDPLGNSKNIRELKLRATFTKGYQPTDSTPNQQFIKQPDGSYHISIHSIPGTKVLIEERKEALQSTPEINSDDLSITTLATKLTSDAKSDSEKVAKLNHWVYDNLSTRRDSNLSTASQVLSHKIGGSIEYSILLIALLRAANLPARKVYGLVYMGDEMASFGRHVWVEVALDGRWVQVDPSRDEAIADATHINLGIDGFLETIGTTTLEKI